MMVTINRIRLRSTAWRPLLLVLLLLPAFTVASNLSVLNGSNGQILRQVEHKGAYVLEGLGPQPRVGFQYDASSVNGASSVRFRIGGVNMGCDSTVPYRVLEDFAGEFNVLEEHEYFVIALTYSEPRCRGTKLSQENFRFDMELIADTPSEPGVLQEVRYSCGDDPTGYHMCLDLWIYPQDLPLFQAAVATWTEKIVDDIPSFPSSVLDDAYACPGGYPELIDDIYMCGKYVNLDGRGNVYGSASVTYIRGAQDFPMVGTMQFDLADISDLRSNGRLQEVIVHELGHLVGLGSYLWQRKGLTGPPEDDCPYYGPIANRRFAAMSNCAGATVPLELEGQSPCGHWDEACLGDEIMTGFLSGVDAPFSRLSMAALHDYGYRVDYSKGDNFSFEPSCTCDGRRQLRDEMQEDMDSDNSVRHLNIYDEDDDDDSLFAGRRRRRPTIRDAIRQTAEDFGKEVLREERRKKREQRRERRRFRPLAGLFGNRNDQQQQDDEDLGGASFVADQFIAVIMQQDEDLFLVGVFADDEDDEED